MLCRSPCTSSPTPSLSPSWNQQEPQHHLRLLMDTVEIDRLLAVDSRADWTVLVIVAKDELPATTNALPAAFECNTHGFDRPGEHWVVLYLDGDGHGEYFCSYGLPPKHVDARSFMKKYCSEWTHNTKRLHNPLSNVCVYCIGFILVRCHGFSMKSFVNALGTDLVANDCRVFD